MFILLLAIVIGEAQMMVPTMVVLGTTAALVDDKAMDHYLAEQEAGK